MPNNSLSSPEKALAGKAFNVRIEFSESGEPIIGWCQGFYDVSENVVDFKRVPDDTVLAIAKKLGISKSSHSLMVNRKAPKKAKQIKEQGILSFENQELA